MDPIQVLMDEHRRIERGLDALDVYADAVAAGESVDGTDLGRFVTFIREYADACHHGKEEDILFEAMVAAGFPKQGGPIAVMLMEHDQGRALVSKLAAAAEQKTWDDETRSVISTAAHGFTGMLRDHILKEDNVLYPMARSQLPPSSFDAVTDETHDYEVAQEKSGEKARLEALGDELAARYAR